MILPPLVFPGAGYRWKDPNATSAVKKNNEQVFEVALTAALDLLHVCALV